MNGIRLLNDKIYVKIENNNYNNYNKLYNNYHPYNELRLSRFVLFDSLPTSDS